MIQERLDNSSTMFTEQELIHNINVDEMIDQFKIINPKEKEWSYKTLYCNWIRFIIYNKFNFVLL